MPDYTIRDPQSGRTLTVRGDSPPNEDELAELFSHGAPPQAVPPAAPQTTGAPSSMTDSVVQGVSDAAIGAVKGVGSSIYGLGKLVHDYTPVGRISDAIQPGAFDQKPPELVPGNTAQKVGYAGEQLGEFFLPTGAVGRVAKAAEVGKAAALTMAQGGTPTEAGLSAGITAVLPGGSAVKRASGMLSEGAEKSMAQGLGATKEWAKSEAKKLAPQMLERGVGGSRKAMLAEAKAAVDEVGPKLSKAYADAAAAGSTVSGDVIRGNIQLAADKFKIKLGAGNAVPIAGTEGILSTLDKLDEFVAQLGPDIPVDKAAAVKRTWDQIVSKAGLFGPKATASATDNANAWAVREGSSAFRELLNANPTIAALNKEFGFWQGLKKVLQATDMRTQAQGGGLVAGIAGVTGFGQGMASGDSLTASIGKAAMGGLAGRQVVKLMQSPYWRTAVSAPLKNTMANMLAGGRAEQIESFSKVLLRSLPSELQSALSQ